MKGSDLLLFYKKDIDFFCGLKEKKEFLQLDNI